jgi:hypothetical protein
VDYQILSAPLDQEEFLFFVGSCNVRNVFYKLAIAEEVVGADSEYSASYHVLLQSSRGTFQFSIHLDPANTWVSDNNKIQDELVFLIGSQIDEIKA